MQTALHFATHAACEEGIRLLLDAGADIDKQTHFECSTALYIAASGNSKNICTLLIERGANVNLLNVLQRTALHAAAATGRLETGVLLLKAGASITACDINGWTPRQVAELGDHRPFQELLVRASMKYLHDKTPILKDLPAAPWHCQLWTDMIDEQKLKRATQGVKSNKSCPI
mmetsp:Transcript_30356/g.28999  ORF Transcript_30356/g.28999 Transcript_30356/m.28999 type:complete len:173 (+) Transcript_30356:353-871(+)|eukprot:CAMPEP_0119038994 /NCGR_PEP_ID=MMETSP1177-20130426/8233_1 /TAXON_ID=2985 /ORGANISM="Ochromonas sp, Strain CCMP1899" /LENGTH=172 /DNA_ID=CAMNT_0007002285 /DNA_START=255 /DNA_END=773 /DNA_ORIENTATION=+